jgi:hypothetical protein
LETAEIKNLNGGESDDKTGSVSRLLNEECKAVRQTGLRRKECWLVINHASAITKGRTVFCKKKRGRRDDKAVLVN